MDSAIFRRNELLLGGETMERIAQKRVIIFGVGGVGSWCAESLVRSGISRLTIVDSDCVSVTNINRQLMATTKHQSEGGDYGSAAGFFGRNGRKFPTGHLRLYHRRH